MLSQPFGLQFSQPSLGLALLPICSVCCCVTATVTHQLVMLADSELTSIRPVVLTGWLPSLSTPSALRSLSLPFQLRALHEPRHLSVGHGVITATAYSPPILPLCIQYIQPTCRDCTLHVPRRLRKVRDSNPPMFPLRAVTLHFAIVASALAASLSFSFGRHSANLPRSVCRYAIATLTLTASCWSSLTTLHLSFMISPDAIIL